MITVIHTYLLNYNTATTDVSANNTRKKVIFENYALFLDCISKINNPEVENTKDIDVVIPMCNFLWYSDSYSKTSRSLFPY